MTHLPIFAVARGHLRLLILIAPLLGGCRSFSVTTRSSPGFHLPALASGGLIIGGVTALGGGEYMLSDRVSERFAEALGASVPTNRVMTLPMVRDALGATQHRELQKRFSDDDKLRSSDLQAFAQLPGSRRYLLWVNAQGKTFVQTGAFPVGRSYPAIDPATGEKVRSYPAWVRETTVNIKDLAVDFILWDLRTGESVWSCHIAGTESLAERWSRSPSAQRVESSGAHGTFERMTERAVTALPR